MCGPCDDCRINGVVPSVDDWEWESESGTGATEMADAQKDNNFLFVFPTKFVCEKL